MVIITSACCKKKAREGVTVTVLDDKSYQPITGIQVYIRDIENHSLEGFVDLGYTDSSGKVNLKLSEKCSHTLDIESGGNDDYYAGDYKGSKPTTEALPKNITIYMQHK